MLDLSLGMQRNSHQYSDFVGTTVSLEQTPLLVVFRQVHGRDGARFHGVEAVLDGANNLLISGLFVLVQV